MKKNQYMKPTAKAVSLKTRYAIMQTLSDPDHGNSNDGIIHWGGETGGDGPDPESKRHFGVWDDF